mgnify:CR=1 FL=1
MVPHSGPASALPHEFGAGRSNGVDERSAYGTLHVVATPIGNLGDITLRAVKVLGSVRLVAAEDTRHTGRLLAHLGIRVPLLSFHEHNRAGRIPRILEALAHGDVALVTDAGTPAVSDPGPDLVAAARAAVRSGPWRSPQRWAFTLYCPDNSASLDRDRPPPPARQSRNQEPPKRQQRRPPAVENERPAVRFRLRRGD